MTKKTIFTFYVLATCLVCLVVSTVMIGSLTYGLIGLSFPAATVDNYNYEQHASDDVFLEKLKKDDPCSYNQKIACKPVPSTDKAAELRLKSWDQVLKNNQRNHMKNIIESLPYFILFSLVGFFHWRMFRAIKE